MFDIELENLTRELSVRYDRVIDAMNETSDLTDEVLEAIELHDKQARLVVSHLGKEKGLKGNKMPNIYSNDGELGFDFEGIFITYPYVSECTRFPVDPVKYYGLTEDQLEEFPK